MPQHLIILIILRLLVWKKYKQEDVLLWLKDNTDIWVSNIQTSTLALYRIHSAVKIEIYLYIIGSSGHKENKTDGHGMWKYDIIYCVPIFPYTYTSVNAMQASVQCGIIYMCV